MHDYQLRVVERMIDSGDSFESIEGFLDGLTHVSEETRAALWLLAWTETGKENRLRCVAANRSLRASPRLQTVGVRGLGPSGSRLRFTEAGRVNDR